MRRPAILRIRRMRALFHKELKGIGRNRRVTLTILSTIVSHRHLLRNPPISRPFRLRKVMRQRSLVNHLSHYYEKFDEGELSFHHRVHAKRERRRNEGGGFSSVVLRSFLQPRGCSTTGLQVFYPSSSMGEIGFVRVAQLRSPTAIPSIPDHARA